MFQINNLNKSYVTKDDFIAPALHNISLTLPDTGMCFIVGKSGSGKSTLFNILTGIDTASNGKISVAKTDITKFNQKLLDNYRNGMIGFVFQEFNLMDDMTVLENIILTVQLQNKKPDMNLIHSLLEKVDLDKSLLNRKINRLSGGQRQRVGIVRALVKNPNIIFADEPTGNLDSESASQVFDLLKDLSKEKLVIIVSHDNENSYKYADRIIELKDGQIISDLIRTNNTKNKVEEKIYLKKERILTQEMLNNLQQQINQKSQLKNNFSPTDPNQIIQERNDFISSPSRLPLKFIFKNALNSFKNKKFFLSLVTIVTIFATLIFSVICFYFLAYKSNRISTHMEIISNWNTETRYSNEFMELVYEASQMYLGITNVLTNKFFLFYITFIPGIMILLYFNMSAKLQNRKIGILRSLGSNGINVGKIFVTEGFIFAIVQTFFIFVLTSFFLFYANGSSLLFGSIPIEKISIEDINSYFSDHVEDIRDFFTNPDKISRGQTLLDKNNSNYVANCIRNIVYPFLIWHPILRVLYFILLNFSFIFFLTIIFTSFIIYKWSTKKPIDILNK
ncbi:lipoprotein ABC transporter ATP-binding protein [Candidatus Phytoplasma ziziphi]|uniref:Lipoprotein ABC transporter ATP-binding protein n=1 Tax=Ziziphus jujuba witches'-broom phytoplasma TaxID=135727 RepID=A0A660HMF6_ZIZJU|nr:ABC transporter ATP-binding protein [Candidatus Phytoplasma ziziphi]AYJ01231.1 lipoprotein ABC transporter ATP-binding protein [Candidatus Phytoplasma ziziphi]